MSLFTPTYKQEQGPPSISWEDYEARALKEYHALLATDPGESAVQRFLEENPSFVPGAWTPGVPSSHPPLHNALLTQPELKGYGGKRPDFAWISRHSGKWFAALVEIEAPGKTLFTSKAVPSAPFTQARNQLTEWRVWFDDAVNPPMFQRDYGIPTNDYNYLTRGLHLILVYGRRSECEGSAELSRLRSMQLTGQHEDLVTFDRLEPDKHLSDVLTVKATGYGRFEVIVVPDTFQVSPHNAGDLLVLDGFEAALDRNPRITTERKDFLKRRVPYWKEWAKQPGPVAIDGDAFYE